MAVCLVRVLSGSLKLQRAQVHGGSVQLVHPPAGEAVSPLSTVESPHQCHCPNFAPQSWLLTALGCAHVLWGRSHASTIYTCQGDVCMGKMTAGCLP